MRFLFVADPKTAVKLKEINSDLNSTYINANYIRVRFSLIFNSEFQLDIDDIQICDSVDMCILPYIPRATTR